VLACIDVSPLTSPRAWVGSKRHRLLPHSIRFCAGLCCTLNLSRSPQLHCSVGQPDLQPVFRLPPGSVQGMEHNDQTGAKSLDRFVAGLSARNDESTPTRMIESNWSVWPGPSFRSPKRLTARPTCRSARRNRRSVCSIDADEEPPCQAGITSECAKSGAG